MSDAQMTVTLEQRQAIHEGAARLHREFSGTFGEQTIENVMADSLQLLSRARYDTYVTMLAERFARERLHAAAKVEGRRTTDVPSVMFLCVHNAGRPRRHRGSRPDAARRAGRRARRMTARHRPAAKPALASGHGPSRRSHPPRSSHG